MRKFKIENVLDQRKAVTHAGIILYSALTAFIYVSLSGGDKSVWQYAGGTILGTIQIELFLYLAQIIFRNFEPVGTPSEVTGKVLSKFFYFILLCFIAAFLIAIGYSYILRLITGGDISRVFSDFVQYSLGGWLKATLSGFLVGGIIFLVILWQDGLRREQKLREENLIFQNETLKNQVNPHFLFNSLNTLSSLIETDPGQSRIFAGKLASIYRYIIDNFTRDRVQLTPELNFLKDYYDLHRIRGEGKIFLELDIPDPDSLWIIPVSLQILLENAIKHNAATRDNPLRIKITIEDGYISVTNNLQKMSVQMPSTGIGLKNLGERVKLISGKTMITEQSPDQFTVKLPLLS